MGESRRENPAQHGPRVRAAATTALAAVTLLAACAAPPRAPARNLSAAPVHESIRAGLDLYASHEFAQAGEHFRAAAGGALAQGDRELAHRATLGECTAWLRARRLQELCGCAERLAESQRRRGRSDPAENTLIAMGAIAGGMPLPELRTPSATRVVLRGAVEER